jgi:long-chain acyl-CoA synthetase
VKASAVIGISDEKSGEIPVAYIELEEGVESYNESELKRYMREHLANYKITKHIYMVEELPKNETGKIHKRVLKEKLKNV